MTGRRRLVVNADDLGLSESVNEGVFEAHERGIVTAATLLVRGPAARSAAADAVRHPRLSIGLHLDLGAWVHRDGTWTARYEVVDRTDRDAVEAEVDRQLASFEVLLGRPPTHLDSHQHVHRREPVASALRAAGRRLGVPVRAQRPGLGYVGGFYGQTGTGAPYADGITLTSLVRLLDRLGAGWSELGCHPGRADSRLDDPYAAERATELAVLCDPRARAALDRRGISLDAPPDRRTLQGAPSPHHV